MAYTYYQMPKFIFGEKYNSVDANAKILYVILLDKYRLSEMIGYKDDLGTFCFMSRYEMSQMLNCGDTSVRKYLKQLAEAGLIFERRQGQGRVNKTYIIIPDDQENDHQKNDIRPADSDIIKTEQSKTAESDVLDCQNMTVLNNNKTKDNNNENSKMKSISISKAEEILKQHFNYSTHFEGTVNQDMADTLISVMAEVLVSKNPVIRIHKAETDIETVRSRIFKLEAEHLDYCIGQIVKSKSRIKGSGTAYMLTCLYDSYSNYNLFFNKSYHSRYAV